MLLARRVQTSLYPIILNYAEKKEKERTRHISELKMKTEGI